MPQDRVSDVYPAVLDPLHDHKMLVATDVQEHHHRDLDIAQGFRRYPVASGAHADTFHVALHVEHGEALDADQILVGV
ncbi:hypothetical protein D3C71_2143110 [compost metagenome]